MFRRKNLISYKPWSFLKPRAVLKLRKHLYDSMAMAASTTGSAKSWHPAMTVDTTTTSYWLNWRVLLCGIWILVSIVFASILILRNECRKSDLDHRSTGNKRKEPPGYLIKDEVWRPCLKSMHPVYLLVLRVFAFTVLLLMLVLIVFVDGTNIFYFYTQWTFILVTIYFALGSLLSIHGCYKYGHKTSEIMHSDHENGARGSSRRERKEEGMNHENQKAGFLPYVFQVIFQMNAGAVILTDIVFWFIIVPFLAIKDYKLNFLNASMHFINAVFLLADTALNCLRFPWFRIGYFFLWTSVYVIFQWILHACISLWWPYPFLDLSSSFSPLWYSAVALMHIPCYGIFMLIMKAKHCLMSKWFPLSYWNKQ